MSHKDSAEGDGQKVINYYNINTPREKMVRGTITTEGQCGCVGGKMSVETNPHPSDHRLMLTIISLSTVFCSE